VASILKSRGPLRRLFGAWLQSCVGTGVGYVGLMLLAVHDLHTAWGIMAVLLADFVPVIALGAVLGALADRHSRRLMMVAGNVLQAVAWCGLALVHTAVPIIALALLAGLGNAVQRPAMRSALPVIAGEAKQVAAAWFDTCRWVGITMGPVIAGGLFAISGVGLPLIVNAASFLIAGAAIATLRIDAAPQPAEEEEEAVGGGLREGLRVAFASRAIATVVTISTGAMIASAFLNVSDPLLITKVLHGSGGDYGLVMGCYGVGLVAASILVARHGNAPSETIMRRYVASLLLAAIGLAGCAIVGSVALATVAFAALGFANSLWVVSETQLIQLHVPNAVQGRLFGTRDNLEALSFIIGLLGAAALVAVGGVRPTLMAAAAVNLVCGAAAIVALRPQTLRRLLDVATATTASVPALELVGGDMHLAGAPTRRFDPDAALAAASRDDEGALIDERAPIPVAPPGA
jgi:MFS family permease